jgi:hypothetical protein
MSDPKNYGYNRSKKKPLVPRNKLFHMPYLNDFETSKKKVADWLTSCESSLVTKKLGSYHDGRHNKLFRRGCMCHVYAFLEMTFDRHSRIPQPWNSGLN